MMKQKKYVHRKSSGDERGGSSAQAGEGDFQLQSAEKLTKHDMPALSRTVFIGGKPPPDSEILYPQKFADNRVITSKYTIWNFIPKNLFEQFRRIANLYFLCIAVIQLLIDSPVSPLTSSAPLAFVVIVTAIKQAYEDWLRHRADNEVNKRTAYVVQDGKLNKILSKDIKVGDIILVREESSFPCDLVLLASNHKDGECHITTANLDGETNLKRHLSTAGTGPFRNAPMLDKLQGTIECESPHPDLYKFIGRLTLYDKNHRTEMFSLGPENLLLRGSRLKNTTYIFGCAVYTGQETKMALNSRMQSNKFSTIEKAMNIYLVVFLIILILEVVACTVKSFYNTAIHDSWYIKRPIYLNVQNVLQVSLSFLVLLNYIIPISMYVTIEMQKFLGSMFFVWDEELYDPITNQCAKCNSSDLNEELGQVNYLFTDKTGTLTENDMRFRQCSIEGKRYLEYDEQLCEVPELSHLIPTPVSEVTPEMETFFMVLVMCHTVQISMYDSESSTGNDNNENFPAEIQASSPDEKALVEACGRFGVVFRGVFNNFYSIDFFGEIRLYERLHVLEFDSERKCMSVVIKDPNGKIFLLNKGAESSLLDKNVSGVLEDTLQHVNDYAAMGLRTLVFSYYPLTEDEYSDYDKSLRQARISLDEREKKVAQMYQTIERTLIVIGAVGVEDRLQDGVPETLESLKLAGIKVWILTGDKLETAVNISHSCGHFKRSMTQLNLVAQRTGEECYNTLIQLLLSMHADNFQSYSLVVDGASLTFALESQCDKSFTELCMKCEAVICCRMSPLQKAEAL